MGLVAASISPAYAVLDITITQGINSARPIAVVPFQWQGTGAQPQTNVSDVVASDLQRSGKFNPIDPKSMPQQPTAANQIQFASWSAMGVEAIVVGTIEPVPGDQYKVSFQLVDVLKGQLASSEGPTVGSPAYVLDSRSAVVPASKLREYAHRISDVVYQHLTGQRGAFLTRIAYVAVDSDSKYPYQLRVSDYDGYNEKVLLRSKEPLMSPSWSPDGSRLAYVSFENQKSEIFIQNIYTQKRTKLTSFPGINGAPRWSPDGKQMAMVLSKDGQPNVYVMNLATHHLTQITHGGNINTEPAWSPDSKSMVFTSNRGGSPQIYQVNLNSGDIKRVSWEGDKNQEAVYTKDGKGLVLITQIKGRYHIAREDLKTYNMQILTGATLDQSASVAPNNSMIIYSAVYQGRRVLALVSMDGRFKAVLPANQGDVQAPAWSPYLN
nr:Tol-Pal system beta propeller repeat protein TolB [Dongshaea marina]